MLKRVFASVFVLFLGTALWAQEDDWDVGEPAPVATQEVAPVATQEPAMPNGQSPVANQNADTASAPAAVQTESGPAEPAPVESREVPVRYWVVGDSAELEAIFVKIEKDTVFLKRPNEAEQKQIDKIADEQNAALQETNGQKVEDDSEDTEEDVKQPAAEVIMTEAVKKEAEASQTEPAEPVAEVPPEDEGEDDDFETALAKEDTRMKLEEIAKVEEEIRQREIQDSIAADSANPFIKIYRLDLKRLYNMEDEEMIDLSLSNYVVPVVKDEEDEIELYPPGKANLLVYSSPASCSLYVNGVPIHQLAPDTIKNIKPGKYTISVMQVLKDVEWWGSAVVRIDADSLNKVEIPVLRPSTRLTLNTDPEAVEVYVDEAPTVNVMPHYMTDIIVDEVRPQPQVNIYFRKVGYRDTTITTEIKAFMPNLINVEMEPVLDDLEFIEEQNAYNAERSKRRVGRGLLWSSIAPFVAAGVMWYLAERDWSDAADKKHAYGMSAFESKDTQKMVKDNHDLNKSGDIKCGVAIGLGAIGAGLLVTGFVLAF